MTDIGVADRLDASLARVHARPFARRLALGVIAVSAVLFFAALPFAKAPLPPIPSFIAGYEAALAINDLITFILLFTQFRRLRSAALLALAAGYLFDALMTVVHALSFPGLFAPTGLLGAGPQTTAWLYMAWHGGFPIFVMAYAALDEGDRVVDARGSALAIVGVILAAAVFTLAATAGHDLLPVILAGNVMTPAITAVVMTVWLLSFAALLMLWRKKTRSVLDLWLMVVMCAWIFDVALSTVFNAGRYDLGFYAGRLYGLLAASFVLAVLLLEMGGLYQSLALAQERLAEDARALEDKVRERTAELERANDALTAEMAERRKTEARLFQAQKMEAIGNLTGGMAHDFNNLIGIIVGNLDLLLERAEDTREVRELAGEALEAGLRGADLNRRLLAFARRQPLAPRRVDLNELVGGQAKLLARTLGEQVSLSFEPAPDLWPVNADPAQLEASLTNLATNARDAMPRGGRLIIATSNQHLDADYAAEHSEVRAGDYAMIEVSDTGAGMTPEVRERIFEPFFTTKGRDRGTGLGLAMVFGFMRQSDGHVSVYSEPGVGTTFRLFLPRASAAATAAGREAQAPEARHGRGETVLAVEDNPQMRRVVTRQLAELGYRVLEAGDVAAAISVLERERVALVLSDMVMPGGSSGLDLAHAVRERWPETRVVLTSGFPRMGEAAFEAAPLLIKPYRRDDLARRVREALDA